MKPFLWQQCFRQIKFYNFLLFDSFKAPHEIYPWRSSEDPSGFPKPFDTNWVVYMCIYFYCMQCKMSIPGWCHVCNLKTLRISHLGHVAMILQCLTLLLWGWFNNLYGTIQWSAFIFNGTIAYIFIQSPLIQHASSISVLHLTVKTSLKHNVVFQHV